MKGGTGWLWELPVGFGSLPGAGRRFLPGPPALGMGLLGSFSQKGGRRAHVGCQHCLGGGFSLAGTPLELLFPIAIVLHAGLEELLHGSVYCLSCMSRIQPGSRKKNYN